MDTKNWGLIRSGPEAALGKFASLPIEKAAVEEFQQVYGALYPGLIVREFQVFVKIFQGAWRATTDDEKKAISQHITAIFERDSIEPFKGDWGGLPTFEPGSAKSVALSPVSHQELGRNDPRARPAVVADFDTGTVTIEPRTLLDWLAESLLKCRNRLAVCEREGCTTPYFVKSHARQRFCTPKCADSARQQKKEQWWAENRERFIKKWRQERKAAKRGKGKQTRRGHARRSKHQTRPITKAT